ncbi:MAG TPA: DUF2281 domain-containing protein [Anaerolineae bacterium]|nr:DUF2281 domain-containing protein [Anaerolineae bacterium]
MSYKEVVTQAVRLPLKERLLLLESLTRSVREELMERPRTEAHTLPQLVRGMLKPNGPMPTDDELKEDYIDHLIEKYL